MRINRIAYGLLAACLLLLLTACASNPIIQTRTVTVHVPVVVAVPKAYTAPVAVPQLADDPVTNADLAAYILALKQAIADANAKLARIAGLSHDNP